LHHYDKDDTYATDEHYDAHDTYHTHDKYHWRSIMIVAIVNQKGGVGKTNLVVNLAFGTAGAGHKTALVDTDDQATALTFHKSHESNHLHLYAAGSDVRQFVKELRENFVFIDTPPHSADIMKLAMMAADLIIIPTRASPYDLHASHNTVKIYRLIEEKIGIAPPCYFLLNLIKGGTLLSKEAPGYIAEHFKLPILKTRLHDYEAFRQAPLAGQSVIQSAPKSKAAAEIRGLLAEMKKIYKSVK
jgi:chromosome partitioning protein